MCVYSGLTSLSTIFSVISRRWLANVNGFKLLNNLALKRKVIINILRISLTFNELHLTLLVDYRLWVCNIKERVIYYQLVVGGGGAGTDFFGDVLEG